MAKPSDEDGVALMREALIELGKKITTDDAYLQSQIDRMHERINELAREVRKEK